MTSKKVVIFIFLLFIVTLRLIADGNVTPTTIDYYQGNIKQDYLPYNKKFILQGSTKLPEGDAKVITLSVTKGGLSVLNNQWRASQTGDNSNFQIWIDPLAELGRQYKFDLTFYVSVGTETMLKAVQNIIASVKERLEVDLKHGSIGLNNVNVYLSQSVENFNKSSNPFFYVGDGGKIQQGLPTADVTAYLDERIFSISLIRDTLELKKEIAEDSRIVSSHDFRPLIATISKNKITEDDIAKLNNFVIDQKDTMTEEVSKRFAALIGKLKEAENEELGKLLLSNDKIRTNYRYIKELYDQIQKFDLALDQLTKTLSQIYTFRVIQTFQSQTWTSSTELDRLLIGTAYGFGTVFLGSNGSDMDWFSYVGLKFYFAPVDYEASQPYKAGSLSRVAVTLGAVFLSDITYRGQKQADLLGGMKPLVGVSYDFDPKLVINGGILFFRQSSINPLAINVNRPKHSFYLGLTLDFDAFNRLKGLMK